ncbi:exosortase K [Salmonirosea aquatica]|uniref:Exosortase K n=1 Tax=Salmonirosea aquatica TaxID=2654236 RepID=A0A7C9BEI2_9BACT|nr:exosortase K [Cytophagaceae bacterium SJW1-29]
MPRNLPYQLAALAIFVLLKLAYTQADTSDLAFLLGPTDTLVGLAANSPSVYDSASGYLHPDLNITIDKSCSGFNFWMLSFLMLSFLSLRYLSQSSHKLAALPLALLCAYGLTIFANTSRITIAVLLQNQFPHVPPPYQAWFHQAQGTFVYLSCLIGLYLTLDYLLSQLTCSDAQPA